ncbi:hypothetical protein Tco_0339768 [Tanacetum coccineum]
MRPNLEVLQIGIRARFQWVSDDELEALEEASQPLEQAPPSSNYMPSPELPPLPDYVPGPEYPEYLEEDPKEDPADRGDDDDDDNDDDDDDDVDEEEAFEEDEDEKHLALADSTTLHAVDHIPAIEDTEAFETPPSPRLRKARISVRPQTPMSVATEALIDAVATALPSSPPPSSLTPLSSPLP